MLDHVMAYTLPQLVDFIVTCYEAYMEKRAVDFSCELQALPKNMTLVQSDVSDSYITTTDADAGVYDVGSVRSDKVYTVDMGRGYCTCYVGASGTSANMLLLCCCVQILNLVVHTVSSVLKRRLCYLK